MAETGDRGAAAAAGPVAVQRAMVVEAGAGPAGPSLVADGRRRRLVLASASPARRGLLRAAGFDPEVVPSGVDEGAVATGDGGVTTTVHALAEAKALAVAARPEVTGALVLGCDSLFEIDGCARGKPGSAEEAATRIRDQRGRSGVLHTGHCLIDAARGERATGVASTTVRFTSITDAEVDAYVATGEPLEVAGAFTLDGRSAVFVAGVDGDPSNVVGLSLPLFRALLGQLDVAVTDLWV